MDVDAEDARLLVGRKKVWESSWPGETVRSNLSSGENLTVRIVGGSETLPRN
jgi:hypothetical protein